MARAYYGSGLHAKALQWLNLAETQMSELDSTSDAVRFRLQNVARYRGSIAFRESRLDDAEMHFDAMLSISQNVSVKIKFLILILINFLFKLPFNAENAAEIERFTANAQQLLSIIAERRAVPAVIADEITADSIEDFEEDSRVLRRVSSGVAINAEIVSPPKKKQKTADEVKMPDKLKPGRKSDKPRPFQCPKCDKNYAERRLLNRHIKTHEGKVPCPRCAKLLASKEHVEVHVRSVHEGEKHRCEVALHRR
jgi:uncharacterized C2H2 Zn-finger protein